MNSEKELEKGTLNNLYLLYGEETYLLQAEVKKMKKMFGECIQGVNYIQVDETNIDNLMSDIETPSFGYEKKLIIIKASLLKKAKKNDDKDEENNEPKREKSQQEKISEYINENINQIKKSVIIIFIEENVEKKELYKTIEKYGVVHDFKKLKLNELIKKLKNICNMYKVNINENTLQYFIETCGTSMQILINEIRKLIEYVGENGTITKEDIDKLSVKELESRIFDLTDNLGKKETKKSLDLLKELIYNKEPIQKILITLYNHFKRLYLVKLSERYNKDIVETLNLNQKQMFLVPKYKKQASYFKETELRQILEELIKLDSNYKSGLIDINIGLEAILCRYC